MFTMVVIPLVVLLGLSTIVACTFAYNFVLGSLIKPIVPNLMPEERFEERTISLTLLIDKITTTVVLAESNRDFVEVLFSFLTLPIGEVIRLCGKNSGIAPLDNLYASVEALEEQSFQTAASKNMLLRPRSAYGYSSGIAIDLDQEEPSLYYICSRSGCKDQGGFRLVSLVKGSECICKRTMEKQICVKAMTGDTTRGFLKDQGGFIISDDLLVLPVTVTNTQRLIKREMKSHSETEVREVTIGTKEVLEILKYSMTSTRPLSDVLLRCDGMHGTYLDRIWAAGRCMTSSRLPASERKRATSARRQQRVAIEEIKGNLLMERSTRKIIALEAREDLADLMFSFLTIPLGSIEKLCRKQGSYLGCISQLFRSIEQLHVDNFKSERSKRQLLSPKIAPKYGCQSQLLDIEEETELRFDPSYRYMYICYECFLKKKQCSHESFEKIAIVNPKIPGKTTGGGGFLKRKRSLIITNDFRVEKLKPALHACGVNSHGLDTFGIDLDEGKALKILQYLMTSANVLDNALYDAVRMPAYSLDT